MKYTKEQLQGMSDLDICVALALITENVVLVYEKDNIPFDNRVCGFSEILSHDCEVPDYCNNPNDIMPLAFEHKICLIDDIKDSWVAYLFNDKHEFRDKNPLRAITCCLILVLQEKQL